VLAKYLELKRASDCCVQFHSFYKTADEKVVLESKDRFRDLEHNVIAEAYNRLLDEVFDDSINSRV
jgi:hypothetical protein